MTQKQSYTPGPWTLKPHGVISGGKPIQLPNGEAQQQIAMACILEDGDQEANARLIAVAPEMLDELRRVRNYLSTEIAYTHSADGEDFATHADYEASLVVHSIDNLIAKATGGQV